MSEQPKGYLFCYPASLQATCAVCKPYDSRHWLDCAAGALRQALLIGYDLPRMEGLWPSEKQCPGFKYVTASVHLCTPVSALRSSWHMFQTLKLLHTLSAEPENTSHAVCMTSWQECSSNSICFVRSLDCCNVRRLLSAPFCFQAPLLAVASHAHCRCKWAKLFVTIRQSARWHVRTIVQTPLPPAV